MAKRLNQRVAEFAKEIAKEARFAEVELNHDGGNLISVAGRTQSHADYDALVERSRQAGFLLLANDFSISVSQKEEQ